MSFHFLIAFFHPNYITVCHRGDVNCVADLQILISHTAYSSFSGCSVVMSLTFGVFL